MSYPRDGTDLNNLVYTMVVAALLYNAWLLSYWFNPVAAHNSLVSALQAQGQPYYQWFVLFDLLSAAVVVLAVWKLFLAYKQLGVHIAIISAGWLLFALGTALDAVLPIKCSANLAMCGLRSSQFFSLHDSLNFIALVGLIVSSFSAGLIIKKTAKQNDRA